MIDKSTFISLSAVLLCGAALAPSADAATPAYATLPVGSMSLSPSLDEKPSHIAPTEKVDGIFVALPPARHAGHSPRGSRYISVFSTKAAAEKFSADGTTHLMRAALSKLTGNQPPPPPSACFTVADHWHMKQGPQPWPRSSSERASIHGVERGTAAAKQYPNAGVRAIHMEQLVGASGDKASLSITDAWIDPASLGTRLIAKSSLPLDKVVDGPYGVRVFAARDKGQDAVHYVVRTTQPTGRAANVVGRHASLILGSHSSSTDCGHSRLTLRATPGMGERGTISFDVVLPSDDEEPSKKDASVFDGSALTKLIPSRHSPEPIKEVRVRTLLVHVSVSQGGAETEPITSVSFGWQGRERRMQTF